MTRSFCPALTQPAGLEAFSYRKALRKPLALEGEMESEVELMVGPSSGSLDFLRLVYSDPSQSINRRTRAAIAALPFEHPKLCVSANVDPTLALPKRLERALKIARGEPLVIDGRAERITPGVDY